MAATAASLQERWPVLATVPPALAWLGMRGDLGIAPRTLDQLSLPPEPTQAASLRIPTLFTDSGRLRTALVMPPTGRLALVAGILNWRPARILRAVTRCLKDAYRPSRPPSMKSQVRGLLGGRLRQLDLPYKAFNQELDHYPKQGFRTTDTNCEYWWINADFFRSWFANRPAEVEMALRLLFLRQVGPSGRVRDRQFSRRRLRRIPPEME